MKHKKNFNPINEFCDVPKALKTFMDETFLSKPTTDWPKIEVCRKNGYITLEAELPGMKKEDINVELEDGALKISGKVELKQEKKEDGYYYNERKCGSFSRIIEVSNNIKPENITAEFADGVLKVVAQDVEVNDKVKKIEVK